ncbi:hypothetical protein ABK040_009380 [Willaertia magna]
MSANTLKNNNSLLHKTIELDKKLSFKIYHNLSNSISIKPNLFQNLITIFWRGISFTNDGWLFVLFFFIFFYNFITKQSILNIGDIIIIEIEYLFFFFECFLLDVIHVGSLKLFWRRKRPSSDLIWLEQQKEIKEIHKIKRNLSFWEVEQGPDKYSFPSGHASRASFILLIFYFNQHILLKANTTIEQERTNLLLTTCLFWWYNICLSRVALGRHFLMDVIVGCFVGSYTFFINYFIIHSFLFPFATSLL